MKARHNPSLVCPKCNYDANLPYATHCEICNQPLRGDRVAPRNITIGWVLVGLILLSGGFYWLGKDSIESPTTVSNLKSPLPVIAPEQVANSSLADPQIRYYNSMSEVPNVPEGLFNYGGAVVFAALTANGIENAIAQAHPQFHLRYVEPLNHNPSSRAGIAMLLNHELSFARTVLPLKDADYDKAQKRGLILEQIPVAIDGIVFFVNPQLPVSGLSVDQLQAIYTGKVTNWNQVGGPNLPIVAIAFDPTFSSTIEILLEGISDRKLSPSVQIARDYIASIRQVASTPGSISYASVASVVNQKTIRPLPIARANSNRYIEPFISDRINIPVFRDGSYPLTRQLFVVLSHEDKPAYQAGVAYTNLLLSKEGQKIIERSGFVPLR